VSQTNPYQDPFFTSFGNTIEATTLPQHFALLLDQPHPLCLRAAEELQVYLEQQKDWDHNFGLVPDQDGTVIGKMFGVLVVKTTQNEIGYLSAFSGKLAGGNHHAKFVPPVFDGLHEQSFVNEGMTELSRIIEEIKNLEELPGKHTSEIIALKAKRKNHSIALQNKIFDHYYFLNQAGEEKSLNDIFKTFNNTKPSSGAGECAGPKLLQYAFQHNMKPIALAEFWWGQSPKSDFWKHGHYYPCCKEKCEPILAHMLAGIDD